MNIGEFLGRLDGVRESGGDGGARRWSARCPAHEDDRQSLSVAEGRDGRILVHCFAGCTAEQVAAALGLRMADLAGGAKSGADGGGTARTRRTRGKAVANYVYQDGDGKPIYRVTRFEPKSFLVSVPDAGSPGGWKYGLSRHGVERVLYRLPEVRAAAAAGRIVFLVEGEKDADNLAKLGVCATTAQGGAEAEWLAGYTAALAGAKMVVVCADNDPKTKGRITRFWAGQRRAWRVGESLRAAGIPVVRMVFPGQGVKDASDWISAGGSAAGLKDLVREYVDGRKEWPAEWRFSSAADDAGGQTDDGGGAIVYKLARGKAIEIVIDSSKSISANVDRWIFEAWKAVQDDSGGRGGELSRMDRFDITALVCIGWMRLRGRFFWNSDRPAFDTSMYYSAATGKLLLTRSDEFSSWISRESGINMSLPLFKYVQSAVDNAALDPAVASGVVPAAICAKKGDAVYISSGDAEMYRIRADGIEKVPVCTDGVVFADGKTLKPWNLLPGGGEDPFAAADLFRGAAFASPNGRMLARLWLLGIFSCIAVRPILVFTGEMRSGKTRLARGMQEVIGYSPRVSVLHDSPTGDRDFWVSLNAGGMVTFDNVDSRVKWFPDAIQVASSGACAEMRMLYTVSDVVTMRPRAHTILTSNSPKFADDAGVADRLVIIRLSQRRAGEESSDIALSRDLDRRRDSSMTWIAKTIQAVLRDKQPVGGSINPRHPDFSEYAQRCGRALGCSEAVVRALSSAETDKAVFAIQNNDVAREVMETMCLLAHERGSDGWIGTAADLSGLITTRLECDDQSSRFYSARRIGKALARFGRDMELMIGLRNTGRTSSRSILYSFQGIASDRLAALDACFCNDCFTTATKHAGNSGAADEAFDSVLSGDAEF